MFVHGRYSKESWLVGLIDDKSRSNNFSNFCVYLAAHSVKTAEQILTKILLICRESPRANYRLVNHTKILFYAFSSDTKHAGGKLMIK